MKCIVEENIAHGNGIPEFYDRAAAESGRTADREPVLTAVRLPVWKRCLDIIGAIVGILLFFPAMVIIALAISLDGSSPVFIQRRPGLNRKLFPCLKFRTMRPDAEMFLPEYLAANPKAAIEHARYAKLENDPRITPIGRFLRDYSLDELPQFFNVLCGDMSLVGPRPRQLLELDDEGQFPATYVSCFEVRPGLTGPWQVSGRSDVDRTERYRLDRDYISEFGFWRDIALIIKTVPAVLTKRGAR